MTRLILLVAAAICTLNAAVAFFAQLSPDFEIYTLAAILCLGTKFAIDYRQLENRRRMIEGRQAVWERHEREAS